MHTIGKDLKPSLFDQEELAHYGVKGMRWGVRRTPEQLRRARGGLQKGATKTKAAIKKSAKQQVDFYKTDTGKKVLGGATVAGVFTVAAILASNGNVPAAASVLTVAKKAVEISEQTMQTKANDVPRPPGPSYQQGEAVRNSLKDDEFMLFDNLTKMYVTSKTHGYNPNNNKFGKTP